MYTQYQNATKFILILDLLRDYFTIPIQQIHDDYFDLNTCKTDGLNNWGIILDTTRNVIIADPFYRRFGFGNRLANPSYPTLPIVQPQPPLRQITYPLNFGQKDAQGNQLNPFWGNFANTISPYSLQDDEYRVLLKFVYLKYVSDRSFNSCLLTINNYINEKYGFPNKCTLTETTSFRGIGLRYDFNFQLAPYEITLFKYNDVLLRPAGVSYKVTYTGTPPVPTYNANFNYSATSGNVPFSVTFTNTTNGIPNVGFTWSWAVTGGTQGTDWSFTTGSSTSQDVVIQFNTASVGGTSYNVTLNASLGTITYTPKTVGITANPPLPIQADFTFLPLLPTTNDTVVFTDTTPIPVPTGYAWSISPTTGWNFVTPTSSISKNPSIQFTTATTYNVTNAPTGSVTYNSKTRPVIVSAAPTNPTVSLTSPNPTTNVSLTPTITLTFSEAVSGVNTTSIQLRSSTGTIITITITQSGNSYTLGLSAALVNATQYTVIVNSGINSVATGLSVVPTQFNFTTTSASGNPTVVLTAPNPTTNVSRSTPITLTFSENVSGVNTNTISVVYDGSQILSITITPNGNSYDISYNGMLLAATGYELQVKPGIRSVATGLSVVPINFNFVTASA